MGVRKPLTEHSIQQIAGKVAVELLDQIEDGRIPEILARWDELREHMPVAFDIALATREALLNKGYGS